jgi:hypothetical protein
VKRDRAHQALLFCCALAAVTCIAELLWLRSVRLTGTRSEIALLFLPWLAAAAANLGVWHFSLARGEDTPLKKMSTALFWIVSAAFTLVFVALYGWLLFGRS